MKTRGLAFRMVVKKEWVTPRQEGRTVRIIPKRKMGLEVTQNKECIH